ncbi:damage-control phosphatase ARMT1-like isoform X2 [Anticarsia gemmatalis]|uniref:damage-control phosphatase ARMT1-like isoform X2 n=1 Tax=Anticarsia gemmatalis TaxID=129554 RepID=UPI003F777304
MSSPKTSAPSSPRTSTQRDSVGVAKEPSPEDYFVTPEFIYGGPFIPVKLPSPFMDSATPINLPLQGTFKLSFAYYSLKERFPVILTKIIDHLSRDGSKIKSASGASDEDLRNFMQVVTKLKNDLVTNKPYDPFTVETEEAKKWNEWIESQDNKTYFLNTWMFTECYVYRKLYEGCELGKSLGKFDYFQEQKNQSFQDFLEPMCMAADKVIDMLGKSEKDKRKADFITLLKLCLWANRCDLSLSLGGKASLSTGPAPAAPAAGKAPEPAGKDKGKGGAPPPKPSSGPIDPIQMILDLKDKLLVDDTGKIVDQVCNKAEAMFKAVEGPAAAPPAGDKKGSPPSTPAPAPAPEGEPEELPKIPCPAKMVIPNHVLFDIVCDNAGYELFADLCFGAFLIEQQIVQKVRFHVKKMPWFVSDVTPRDFKFVINACMNANYSKDFPQEPKEGDEGPPEVKTITSENLRQLGNKFNTMYENDQFIVLAEDFWTYPHVYRDMKKYDYNMYRTLQYAVAIMFKGDLNYRKLLGDRNVNPYTGFEPCLQGFIPAPIIAVRTVKAELICAMPKGKYEQLCKLDEQWMQKGEYGVIHFCPKAEPLKPSDRPCLDYGDTCRGVVCPEHDKDM